MEKKMRALKGVILSALLVCFLLTLTGCGGIKSGTREDILSCLGRKGYIGRGDSREYTEKGMGTGPVPYVMYYDYIYSDKYGELYNIRIYPSHSDEQEEYDIEIFYDIEIEESVVESGGREYTHVAMSDYVYEQELQVERRNWFIFKWYVVAEDW